MQRSLDQLLEAYRKTEPPTVPIHLGPGVWREIRLRKDLSAFPALDGDFLNWFRGSLSALVGPALAVALIMGVGMTLLDTQMNSPQRVQRALGLQVFSHQASPLTRLAANP